MTNFISALIFVLGTAELARAYTVTQWQYAGEKYGIAFFFKGQGLCEESDARLVLKVVNERPSPGKISFRVNDLNWQRNLEIELDAGAADSTWSFHPGDRACRPFINNIFVEETGVAEESAPTSTTDAEGEFPSEVD